MNDQQSGPSQAVRLGVLVLIIAAIAAGSLIVRSRTAAASKFACSAETELGAIEDVCVAGYSLVASYDALPPSNQKELFRLQEELPIIKPGFTGSVDSSGQFRVTGDEFQRKAGERLRTEVIVDVHETASFDNPERWQTVQEFLVDVKRPFSSEAKKKSPKGNKASCDPTNAWTLLKLSEEPLRRCLRTMFLLDMTDTFNERTQKLFENQTMKYSDGTTGPLSLKRESLTDSDRGKVVSAVKAIDTKARALGGYH
jgi:hypothetical protein